MTFTISKREKIEDEIFNINNQLLSLESDLEIISGSLDSSSENVRDDCLDMVRDLEIKIEKLRNKKQELEDELL